MKPVELAAEYFTDATDSELVHLAALVLYALAERGVVTLQTEEMMVRDVIRAIRESSHDRRV